MMDMAIERRGAVQSEEMIPLLILEGKPGRGKTHLAIAIAYRALQNGFDVLFTTAAQLIDSLSAASREGPRLLETVHRRPFRARAFGSAGGNPSATSAFSKSTRTALACVTSKGRSVPGNATPHPLSGILSCGACGAPMVVNGGSDRRRYACAHARQRQTCENKVTVRVSDAQDAILGALRRRFTNPVAIAYVRRRVVGRLTEMLHAIDAEIAERRARLQRVEVRARRILDLIADGESGPTAMSAIRDFEAQANDERAHIAALEAQKRLPVRIPSNDEIREQYFALEKIITADPMRGREALRQLFRGGLKLVPDEDGIYIARGDLSWLGFVLSPSNAKPSADDSGRVSGAADRRP